MFKLTVVQTGCVNAGEGHTNPYAPSHAASPPHTTNLSEGMVLKKLPTPDSCGDDDAGLTTGMPPDTPAAAKEALEHRGPTTAAAWAGQRQHRVRKGSWV